MQTYKGIAIDDSLLPLIGHMESVQEYREMLQTLQAVWDNLTLLGQLSGTGTDMSGTRQAFGSLTAALLNNLGIETRKKVVLDMESKAQVAVDIMVRNLFERTADIGFLATDDDIRAFLEFVAHSSENIHFREEIRQRRESLAERFKEYARKYTVYRNIILLDTEGKVLAQLDASNEVEASCDPLIAESLSTEAAYVETFRHTDLVPGPDASLIYSYRVTTADGAQPLGVLCLCFRFENETDGIFGNLAAEDDWSVLMLLDADGNVIASSDAYQVPVGARLEKVLDADCKVVRFAGREYLASTRVTKGYQGYMGPGWMGHVMMPLEKAFARSTANRLDQVPPRTLAGVMMSPTLFSESLRTIPVQAEKIQRELNRSVWNGNVRQSSDKKAINPAFSKVLLWEISNTGLKTRDVFARSIGNLHETVVSAILQDCEFVASLAIDIMDRNLYERSDDCRWWALTTAFREILAAGPVDTDGAERIAAILRYINGLYTVYTNLLVFDANGLLVAVSNEEATRRVGKPVGEEWVRRTLGLKDSQSYAVSSFDPTDLYNGAHTYIYAAGIRAPNDDGKVVGGIGIVFDSTPQFEAMLSDSLPRDEKGAVPEGCFGVFADRKRRVIASTDPGIATGGELPIDDAFFALDNGRSYSNIIELRGQYYAVGSKMSSGYREFKGKVDAYQNDVAALIFIPLGQVQEMVDVTPARQHKVQTPSAARSRHSGLETTEIATFYIGEEWFGIPSQSVVEAIDAVGITPLPGMPEYVRGVVMFGGDPILVFCLRDHLHFGKPVDTAGYTQIVVVRGEASEPFGILVHRLGEIPEVDNSAIDSVANLFPGEGTLSESVVRPDPDGGREGILVVLSPERIRLKLVKARERANVAGASVRGITGAVVGNAAQA
jgi:chemotaxis signal transduction protein